nr:retrovirus-related Pol polyprotein from transposon TNT 1-94 [Tanacetum cinerariifolium]
MDLLPWVLICTRWSVTTAKGRDTFYDWSFQVEEEPTNYALMAFSSLSSSSDNEVRDNALVSLRQTLEKAEQERDDLKLKYQSGNGYHVVPPLYTGTFMPPKPNLVFNNALNDVETEHLAFIVKISPIKPDQDMSHTYRPSAPIIEDWVSDSEDESETKTPQNVSSFVQSTEQVKTPRLSVQHVQTSIPTVTSKTAILKPTSNGKHRNRKACFKMAQTTPRTTAQRGTHKKYAQMTLLNPQRHVVPAAVLPQSKLIPITAVRPVSTAVPKPSVTRPRHDKPVVTKTNSPPRRIINCSSSPKASNSPPIVTVVKAPMVNAAKGNPQHALKDKGVIDSGCSRHMTGNMSYLSDFEELNGGYVAFGGNPKGGKISGKGKIRTGKLDFDDVYFVKELKFNLFSVSQMCDKKNSFLSTDTKCLVLSLEFKMPDESQVLLRVPRENNTYNVNLNNIVPFGDLTCLFAKATLDESNLWHRRLGHINFKTMNKLVKVNLVRGLPFKVFENDNTCVACKKGKQHRASCLEKQLSLKVKVIRSDNGTEFKNNNLNQFCGMKGIKREFSVPKTPQQNGIAKRKNRTLIEAARTMLADSLLPIPFWAEAVNTTCYVQNRVLVTKPHNKTLYELLHCRTPSISFMRPFGCPVTILNTLDSLSKFDGKVDEGFLVRYSVSSKAFRVFNSRTRIVQETLHVNFLENKPNVAGEDIVQQYVLFPVWSSGYTNPHNTDGDAAFDEKEPEFDEKKPESEFNVSPSSSAQSKKHDDKTKREAKVKSLVDSLVYAFGQLSPNITNTFSAAGPSNAAASPTHGKSSCIDTSQLPDDPNMLELEDITYSDDEDDVGAEADFNNLETSITVSPIPTTKVHKDHLVTQIIGIKRMKEALWSGTKLDLLHKDTQEEGIDYEEVFAPVARIEAIRLFLAYASFMGFMVYQIDVKSAFLYGTIKEEVYVCQPLGFEYSDYPDKVYKVVKALYGLHQAPRAWYETLANYLLKNGFQRGKIDQTLFIKRQKAFEKLMKDKFQMSSMRELTFLLGLQVKQKKDGIFISQDKYVAKILRKFGMTDKKSASTPIDTKKPLLKDPDGEDVDVHTYISMIGSLMYLTSSRPNIMFAVCACAYFQVTPKASHLHAVKRIFKYLKGKSHLGLWYLKDSLFDLVAYSDSDYAGASLDRKSTTKGCQFLECRLISWKYKKQTVVATSFTEAEYVAAASCCAQVLWIQNQLLDYGSIKYALTVNPNIYVSCIKQFWTSVAVKNVNDVTRLQALVDKKKVVIMEASIRDALHLDDAEGDDDEVHVKDVNAAGVATEGVVSAVDDIVPTFKNP